MTDMYRAYNRPRQCCDHRAMNNCVANNSDRINISGNVADSCHHGCAEEANPMYHKKKEHMPIGMAYVPIQEWSETYDACEGLYEGCAFPELNLIFCGVRRNGYECCE